MSATVLDGVTRLPTARVAHLTDDETSAACQAIATGEAIDLGGRLRFVPDVLMAEVYANAGRVPYSARLSWGDDVHDDFAGRSVTVFALPDPRPPHPERMPA